MFCALESPYISMTHEKTLASDNCVEQVRSKLQPVSWVSHHPPVSRLNH